MKLTVSADLGLIRGEAHREGMFKGDDAAQTYRARVGDSYMRCLFMADVFQAASIPWVHNLLKGSPITRVFQQRMGSFSPRARELIENIRVNGAATTNDREDLLSQILDIQKKHPQIVDERAVHK